MANKTDKERILMEIIWGIARPNWQAMENGATPPTGAWVDARPESLVKGAMVICLTSGRFATHPHLIGIVEKVFDKHHCLIREIGSNRTCDISNESFYVIQGLVKERIFEGDQYEFYLKVRKAFYRGDDDWYRFGGLEFDGNEATIWIREKFGGMCGQHERSVPFCAKMKFNKRTTIKSILEAMVDAGYGTKEFGREPRNIEATA